MELVGGLLLGGLRAADGVHAGVPGDAGKGGNIYACFQRLADEGAPGVRRRKPPRQRQAVSVIQPDAAFDLLSIFHDGVVHGGVAACMTGDELGIRQRRAAGEQVGEQRAAGIMRPEVA